MKMFEPGGFCGSVRERDVRLKGETSADCHGAKVGTELVMRFVVRFLGFLFAVGTIVFLVGVAGVAG